MKRKAKSGRTPAAKVKFVSQREFSLERYVPLRVCGVDVPASACRATTLQSYFDGRNWIIEQHVDTPFAHFNSEPELEHWWCMFLKALGTKPAPKLLRSDFVQTNIVPSPPKEAKVKSTPKTKAKRFASDPDAITRLTEVMLAVFFRFQPKFRNSTIHRAAFFRAVEVCFPRTFVQYCLGVIYESPPDVDLPYAGLVKWLYQHTNERQILGGRLLQDCFHEVAQHADEFKIHSTGRTPITVDPVGGRKPGGRFGA